MQPPARFVFTPTVTMYKRTLTLACATASLLLFAGCAAFNRIADYPTPGKETTVAVVAKPMSKMSELPVGAFYDEPRQIIISGHQKVRPGIVVEPSEFQAGGLEQPGN